MPFHHLTPLLKSQYRSLLRFTRHPKIAPVDFNLGMLQLPEEAQDLISSLGPLGNLTLSTHVTNADQMKTMIRGLFRLPIVSETDEANPWDESSVSHALFLVMQSLDVFHENLLTTEWEPYDRYVDAFKNNGGSSPVPLEVGTIIRHKKFHYHAVVTGWDDRPRVDVSKWEGVQGLPSGEDQPFLMVVVDTADSRKYFSNGEPSTLYVALENAEVVTYDNAPDRGGAPVNSPLLQNFFGRFDWESYRFLPLPMLDWPIRYCEAVFGKQESQPQERNTPSSSQPSDLVTWDKYQQLQADLKPLIDLHIERLYAVLDSIIDSDDQQDKFEICAPVLQTCLDHEFRVYRNFLEHGESLIAHFGDNDVSRMLFRCDIDLVEGVHVAEVSLRHKFRVRCKKQLDYVMHFAKFGIPAEDVFDFKSGDIVQFQNEDGEVQRGAITFRHLSPQIGDLADYTPHWAEPQTEDNALQVEIKQYWNELEASGDASEQLQEIHDFTRRRDGSPINQPHYVVAADLAQDTDEHAELMQYLPQNKLRRCRSVFQGTSEPTSGAGDIDEDLQMATPIDNSFFINYLFESYDVAEGRYTINPMFRYDSMLLEPNDSDAIQEACASVGWSKVELEASSTADVALVTGVPSTGAELDGILGPKLETKLFDLLRFAPSAQTASSVEHFIWKMWSVPRLRGLDQLLDNGNVPERDIAEVEAMVATAHWNYSLRRKIEAYGLWKAVTAMLEDERWSDNQRRLFASCWFHKGSCALECAIGTEDDWVDDFNRAIELEPKHFGAMLNKATVLQQGGFTDAADAMWREARKVHPWLVEP